MKKKPHQNESLNMRHHTTWAEIAVKQSIVYYMAGTGDFNKKIDTLNSVQGQQNCTQLDHEAKHRNRLKHLRQIVIKVGWYMDIQEKIHTQLTAPWK